MQERFADQLIRTLQNPTEPQHQAFRKSLTETMTHPLTIKIMVDAKHLEDMLTEPHLPPNELTGLTWPLNQPIYVEPTEPIKPARLQMLEAILKQAVRQAGYDPDPERMCTRALLVLPTGRDRRTLCILNTWAGQVLASTMELTMPTGGADTEIGMNQPDQAEAELRQYDITSSLQFFGNSTILLMADISRMGMMQEPEPIPKQQRRRLERQGTTHSWYVIRGLQPHAGQGDTPRPPQRQPETAPSPAVQLSTPAGATR